MTFLQPVINWFSELSLAEWLGIAGFGLGIASFGLGLRNYFQARHKHELDTLKPRLVEANNDARERIAALRRPQERLKRIKWNAENRSHIHRVQPKNLGSEWEAFLDPTTDIPQEHKALVSAVHKDVLENYLSDNNRLNSAVAGMAKIQEVIDKETQGIEERNKRLRKLNIKHKLSD